MAWDYDWKLGPKGGTLIDLDVYCDLVRLDVGADPIGAKRGVNVINPYRHGTVAVEHKYNTELLIPLELGFKGTTPTTISNNKTTVEKNLFGVKGLATLRRTTPEDTVEAYVEPVTPSIPTQNRFVYLYLLTAPEGFWRSTTQTTDSTTPIAVGGNGSVADVIIDIIGGTGVVVTMTADGATITITGATPAGGVRVDLEAGSVTKITGGADYHEFVAFNRPYRVILEPGDNAFTTAGTPTSVTFKWFDKYR